jgi:hypothetical protein
MKKINVLAEIKDFKGNPVAITPDGPLTIKEALLNQLGNFRPQGDNQGMKVIQARAIGQKLYDHKEGEFECEDSEFAVIKESMAIAVYPAIAMAIVWEAVKKAEAV